MKKITNEIKQKQLKSDESSTKKQKRSGTPKKVQGLNTNLNRSRSVESNKSNKKVRSVDESRISEKQLRPNSGKKTVAKGLTSRVNNLENMIQDMYYYFKKSDGPPSNRKASNDIKFDDLQDEPEAKQPIMLPKLDLVEKENEKHTDVSKTVTNLAVDRSRFKQDTFKQDTSAYNDESQIDNLISIPKKRKNMQSDQIVKDAKETKESSSKKSSDKNKFDIEERQSRMKSEYEKQIEKLNKLVTTKNDECENLKSRMKDMIKENDIFSTEIKESRNQIENLQAELREADMAKSSFMRKEEDEYEAVKVLKDDINSLSIQTQQVKKENEKLKEVKAQKEDYIQVLLTEKQQLHEEINDLKNELRKNLTNNTNKTDTTLLRNGLGSTNSINKNKNYELSDEYLKNKIGESKKKMSEVNSSIENKSLNSINNSRKPLASESNLSKQYEKQDSFLHQKPTQPQKSSPQKGRFDIVSSSSQPFLQNKDVRSSERYEFKDQREDTLKERNNVISDLRNSVETSQDKFEKEYKRLVKNKDDINITLSNKDMIM